MQAQRKVGFATTQSAARLLTPGPGEAIGLNIVGRLDVVEDDLGPQPPQTNPVCGGPDAEAAKQLVVKSFAASGKPRPFYPFTVSWQVDGPARAISRVNHLQLNTPSWVFRGLPASGSVQTSIPATGKMTLFAVMSNGCLALLAVLTVKTDDADCVEQGMPLTALASQLEAATPLFLLELAEENDVPGTVTLLSVHATASSVGINYVADLRVQNEGRSLTANLRAWFAFIARNGQLEPGFRGYGVSITDLEGANIFEDIGLFFLCGPSPAEAQNMLGRALREGLGRFAENAGVLMCRATGLPNAKVAAAWIRRRAGADDYELVLRCCSAPALVSVSGLFSVEAIAAADLDQRKAG